MSYLSHLREITSDKLIENKIEIDRFLGKSTEEILNLISQHISGERIKLPPKYQKILSAYKIHRNYNNEISLRKFIDTLRISEFRFNILAPSVSRQNLHEKACFKNLQDLYPKVIQLPLRKQGKHKSIYVNELGAVTSIKPDYVKSIDFYLANEKIKMYIMHKHIEDAGGAQDNQINDIEKFLGFAARNKDIVKRFITILDGRYAASKMDNLRDRFDKNKNILVCDSANFG